jgi:hypothetical protein
MAVMTTRTRTIAATVTIGTAFTFFVAAPVMVYKGFDGRAQVRSELRAENIVTPEDASIPNARVEDARTAQAQADIIKVHTMKATGGKTYSQLERTDPVRATAFQGDMLRTALLSSVLAWNVANLVIGLGFLVFALGLALLAVGLYVRRPETVLISTAPQNLREPVTTV